jgi:catechol 2,3-dioxygenase-like lactoylglutathione lyase family enzyme
MIDHTGLTVADFETSKAFYSAALQPIGYELLLEFPAAVTGHSDVAGFGERPKADFWINRGTPNKPALHIAFRVNRRSLVDAFYNAALAAGGGFERCSGPAASLSCGLLRSVRARPGRPQYRSRVSRTRLNPSILQLQARQSVKLAEALGR